jgi:hypothetical protein
VGSGFLIFLHAAPIANAPEMGVSGALLMHKQFTRRVA